MLQHAVAVVLLAFAPVAVALAAVAGAAAVDCPLNPSGVDSHPPRPSAEHCELFCNGSCPYHPDWSPMKPENVSVYRITPSNVTGLSQKDTGDDLGDAGFYAVMMLPHLSECKPPYTSWGCFLADNAVVTKSILETDGEYGPYLKCNPRNIKDSDGHTVWVDTAHFDCTYGNNIPYMGVTGGCACARANKTVGMDPVMHNPNCTKPNAAGKIPPGCQGVGFWYSTTAEGQCTADARPGDGSGCTWRSWSVKSVNATCMRDHVLAFVGSSNPTCFAECPGGSANISSSCSRGCYEQTMHGGLEAKAVQALWDKVFTSNDPTQGGCPAVPAVAAAAAAGSSSTVN